MAISRYRPKILTLLPADEKKQAIKQYNGKSVSTRCFTQHFDKNSEGAGIAGQIKDIVSFLKQRLNEMDPFHYGRWKHSDLLPIQILKKRKKLYEEDSTINDNYYVYSIELCLSSTSQWGNVCMGHITINAPFGTCSDLLQVFYTMQKQNIIRGIHLCSTPVTASDDSIIFQSLQGNFIPLTNLKIYIKSKSLIYVLSNVLQKSTTLEYLDLNIQIENNNTSNDTFFNGMLSDILKQGFKANQSLQEVDLSAINYHNGINCFLENILQGLIGHETLKHLDVSRKNEHFSYESIVTICDILSHPNCQLETLNVSSNYPKIFYNNEKEQNKSHVLLLFAKAILKNKSLMKLNVMSTCKKKYNSIFLNDHVLQACALLTTLECLYMSDNKLDVTTVTALAELIRTNTSLLHVGLEQVTLMEHKHNTNNKNDWQILFQSLATCNNLKSLSFRQAQRCFNVNEMESLCHALTSNNNTLQRINLSCCELDDELITILAESLPFMKHLKELNISNNEFGIPGAQSLVNGMKQNYSLISVDMERDAWSRVLGHAPAKYYDPYEKEYIEFSFYLKLNPFRGLLLMMMNNHYDSTVKLHVTSLWPLVLEKANNDLDIIYCLIRGGITTIL